MTHTYLVVTSSPQCQRIHFTLFRGSRPAARALLSKTSEQTLKGLQVTLFDLDSPFSLSVPGQVKRTPVKFVPSSHPDYPRLLKTLRALKNSVLPVRLQETPVTHVLTTSRPSSPYVKVVSLHTSQGNAQRNSNRNRFPYPTYIIPLTGYGETPKLGDRLIRQGGSAIRNR